MTLVCVLYYCLDSLLTDSLTSVCQIKPAQTRFHDTYCDVITLACRPLVSLQRNELLYSMQAVEGLSRDGHILLDSRNRRIPGGAFRLDQTPHADPEKSFRYAPAEVS
ncbi:hypothetical protein ILYODFUR_022286 [Ilyodon furcidens]|uniref:Uncharacterized protein n=1 Tax=Ilyodon furcidens TaxID=33524 RepID=A0ABV0TZJ1_9TELE